MSAREELREYADRYGYTEHVDNLLDAHAAEVQAEVLPLWEAVYEPGNVSNYLIGYLNDEAVAKGAAETWLRAQRLDKPDRLEWTPQPALATGRYDAWFDLIEHHDDGIPAATGLTVRRRTDEQIPGAPR